MPRMTLLMLLPDLLNNAHGEDPPRQIEHFLAIVADRLQVRDREHRGANSDAHGRNVMV